MELASGKLILVKILHCFSLMPTLKKLYMSSKTAPLLRWHVKGRIKDGKSRHPIDAEA